MTRLAIVFLALLLPACASLPAEDREAISDAKAFVLADLQAAEASAIAHDDVLAAQCWRALIDAKVAASDAVGTEIKGAFSGVQAVRNARRKIQSGLSDEVKIGCGPLALDVAGTYGRLARLLAGGL